MKGLTLVVGVSLLFASAVRADWSVFYSGGERRHRGGVSYHERDYGHGYSRDHWGRYFHRDPYYWQGRYYPYFASRYGHVGSGVYTGVSAAWGWCGFPLMQFEVAEVPQKIVTVAPPPPPRVIQPLALTGASFETQLVQRGSTVIPGVEFKRETQELLPGSEKALEPVANFIKQNPTRTFTLRYYTDSNGDPAYLRGLARMRASNACQALVSVYGISRDSVTAEGMGWIAPPSGERSPVYYSNHLELRLNER